MKPNLLALPLLLTFSASVFSGGWVDDWFDNANLGSASSYESQKRGHYSAGSFSGRVNMGTDSLVSIAKPRVSAGCGGIDVFLGGISFLDADYMVEKLENMLQAAPAVAFDMALKTMCKECSETITKMEAAADWLNSMQLNECAATKRMVASVSSDNPNVLGDVWNEINNGVSLDQAMERSWQEAQEKIRAGDGAPTADLKIHTEGCPDEFRNVFKTGSILAHATDKVGLDSYEDLMRGFIGDVYIRAEASDKIPRADKMLACKENNQTTIDDFLTGNLHKQSSTGTCTKDSTTSVTKYVEDRLKAIATKIKNRTVLTSDEEKFIKTTTSIPVYRTLSDGIIAGDVGIKISLVRDLVAVAYAKHIFDDLYSHIELTFRYLEKISSMPGVKSGAGTKQCNIQVYQQPISQFRELYKKVSQYRELASKNFNNRIITLENNLNVARRLKQQGDDVKSKNALDYQRTNQ